MPSLRNSRIRFPPACQPIWIVRLAGLLTFLIAGPQALEAQELRPEAPDRIPNFLQMELSPMPQVYPPSHEDFVAKATDVDDFLSGGEPAITSWLYAADSGADDDSSNLYRLGVTASGGFVELANVGETGIKNLFDIAFMGSRLFGIAYDPFAFGTADAVLVELNPATRNPPLWAPFARPAPSMRWWAKA